MKRFLAYNDIQYEKFKSFISTKYSKISYSDYINKVLNSYEKIKKIIIEFLTDPSYSPCDERGFYFIFHHNIPTKEDDKRYRFIEYTKRFIKSEYKKIVTEMNEKNI